MIPKIAKLGNSFKGAGLYYLHDKDADTSERVAFTHTENLPTDNPEMALKMMAHTALRQEELKQLAGAAATGRKLARSVYSYSLSWSPEQDPTQAQMIEAAKETIEILGLKDHEILMVAHNDTAHPHIHVIVNRVHPENGIAAKHSNDRLKLSKWAEDYERRMGEILCTQRVENNARRARGEFVKYQSALDIGAFHRWRKTRLAQAHGRRKIEKDMLAATHKGQRDALYDHKEALIKSAIKEIRAQNKDKWDTLLETQRAEIENLNRDMNRLHKRLISHPEDRSLHMLALDAQHTDQRKRLYHAGADHLKNALADINKRYKAELKALKNVQREESHDLSARHSQESQNMARDIKGNKDIEIFRAEKKSRPAAAYGIDTSAIAAPPQPPALDIGLRPPTGPAHEARQERALYEQHQQILAQRLQALKDENRPKWAALFKEQRAALRRFDNAQKAVLPRLLHHIRTRDPRQPGLLPGVIRALFTRGGDLQTLQARHESERKRLARQAGQQRRQAEKQVKQEYQRDLARLELELAREAAAYKKAVEEGRTQAKVPDEKPAPGVKRPGDEFAREMRARIDEDKKRQEEERKRKGRERD